MASIYYLRKSQYVYLILIIFALPSIHSAVAQEIPDSTEFDVAVPDIIIDFEDSHNWYGLEIGNNPYWIIEDGVGKFHLSSEYLTPGQRQLESASIDFQKILGEQIGEDWVLRYKLTIDEFKQGKDSSWSQLLIGLFSKPTSGINSDITHADANQWGLGTAFMTGVDMKRTMLMYDLGFYLEWHSQPEKGQFENENSLPGNDKKYWIEYRKMKSFLTVSIFDNDSYSRESLIEKQHTEGWANADNLQYFRLFPLVETDRSDGIITGTIDDIEFYNNKRWVTKNFDEGELEQMKTFEERLQDLFEKQNQKTKDLENKHLEKLKKNKIPNWLKFPANLWADNSISDDDFFQIIEYLVKEDILAVPLSDYGTFDSTYKPQTIKIPVDPECITCTENDFVDLRWKIPNELNKKGSSSQIFIYGPDDNTTQLLTLSDDYVKFEITNESIPGIYRVDVIYANEKFEAPSFMLTENEIPKLPFWIKQDVREWSNNEKTIEKFKDVLHFLIKEKFIDIEPSNYIKPEVMPPPTEKQILLSYFPNDNERKEFEPNVWKYYENYARGIFQYSTSESMLIKNSVSKILYDNSRVFEPVYNKHQVPYILMELYKYDSNENARTFVDKYPRVYNAFFEQSDMSGTSDETGDCMYNHEKNFINASQDEIHMVICIYDNLALLITVYEDYPNVDSSLIFNVADTFFEKIHNRTVPKLENVLKQNFFETIPETTDNVSEQQNSTQSEQSTPSEQMDPELSGAKVGIQNFSCIRDDFGFVEINGEFSNDETFYERIVFSIILKSYDGTKLAQGDSEILNVQPYEIRKFDGYVALDEPFYECNAVINWGKSE